MQSGSTQKDSVSALSGGTNFSATWLPVSISSYAALLVGPEGRRAA
jgi:hypothetical protein